MFNEALQKEIADNCKGRGLVLLLFIYKENETGTWKTENSPVYHVLPDGMSVASVYFEDGMIAENVMNGDIMSQEIFESKDNVSEERKPKFRVGDVVESTNGMTQAASSYPVYIIKESIKVMDGDNVFGYSYEAAPIDSPDESIFLDEEVLLFQYHDTNWYEYFTESVKNNLPAWKGELYNYYIADKEKYKHDYRNDTIPSEYMIHILINHSLYGRIGNMISDHKTEIMTDLDITTKAELESIRESLIRKLISINDEDTDIHHPGRMANRAHIEFTEDEIRLADEICSFDKKDIFPLRMSSLQIMHSIKEAYKTAEKAGRTKGQIETDRRTGEKQAPIKGQRVYRGRSDTYNLTIEFWFDLDLKIITTAYPVGRG